MLAALGLTRPPAGTRWPRIWWCPVGPLAYLPLHAAGRHLDGGQATVMDRVVSSYTATIRVLEHARAAVRPVSRPRTALIVVMRETPGQAPLNGVTREGAELARLLPASTIIAGEAATFDTVCRALGTHPVAHFACHGVSDWMVPGDGRLLLHDHLTRPLTIAAVSRLRLDTAELAYLSACSTTDTGPALVDESVHLTAAFQVAGYRQVIGTLWPVPDRIALRIAVGVYRRLTGGGRSELQVEWGALALHHAIRGQRDRWPDRPALWTAHVHVGT